MFYTIANLIKAPEMKPKCTTKGQWLVTLTLLFIFFAFLRNYGVSSAPISNPLSKFPVFSSSKEKNVLDLDEQNSKDDFKLRMERSVEKDLNSKTESKSGWLTSDWKKVTNMNYDNYACVQLYKADRFPGVATSPNNSSSASTIYLNTTDFNFEVDKCLKAALFLRSTCQTIDTIKSLKEIPTPTIELKGELEFGNYGGTSICSVMTMDDLDKLAEAYLDSYICFLRHRHNGTWVDHWTNCQFEKFYKPSCRNPKDLSEEEIGSFREITDCLVMICALFIAASVILGTMDVAGIMIQMWLIRNKHDVQEV